MTLPESQWSKDNPGSPPRYVSFAERALAIVERVVERHRKNTQLQNRTYITPDQKKQRAKELREAADALERQ